MLNSLRWFLALTFILLHAGAPLRAHTGPTLFLTSAVPPTPPHFAASGTGLADTSLVCVQALADSAVNLPTATTPWREERAARTIVTDQVHSEPRAIAFVEDSDGVPANGGDIDSVGQEIAIPADAGELYGSLFYRYQAGTTQAGDRLEVELYVAGQLDAAGLLATFGLDVADQDDGTWRRFDWETNDAALLAELRERGDSSLLVTMRSAIGGPAQQVWVDDIAANICAATASIRGQISQSSSAAPNLDDALVALARNDASGSSLVASTTADQAGNYSFSGIAALSAGASYQIWFVNNPTAIVRDDRRLGFWAGPIISELAMGADLANQNFDVSDAPLVEPASYSSVVATDDAPVTLRWSARGVPGERHQFCIYDPQLIEPISGLPPQACGPLLDPSRDALSFALAPASFSAVPALNFRYGRSYRWYVVVYGALPASGQTVQYGYSFYERAITLLPQLGPPLSGPSTPATDLPGPGVADADWTLLVYAAGDNALGDPLRAPRLSQLDTQLASLPGLAAAYPRVNIVTLSDSYSKGASLCYLPATGVPDCRERGELDMGAPATLGDFLSSALERYPARRTMLVLAGPGHPIGGIGPDETTTGAPAIDLSGLRSAFGAAGLGTGGKQLDIIMYQAPLMGTVEVAAASGPYGRFMVAAADQTWSLPLYDRIVPLLAGAQGDQPGEVAKGIVAAYDLAVAELGSTRARSMAAYDLSQIDAVDAALNSLGAALASALSSDSVGVRAALDTIRASVQVYDSSGNGLLDKLQRVGGAPVRVEEDAFVDLARLAGQIVADASLPDTVRGAATTLLERLTSSTPLIIASRQRSGLGIAGEPINLGAASGMAVFFPTSTRLGGQPTMVQLYLYTNSVTTRDTAWASFLRAKLADQIGVGLGGVTAGPLGGAQFRAPVGGLIRTDLYLPLAGR